LLSEKLLPAQVKDGRVLPSFLGPEDRPWVTKLLETAAASEGRRARELSLRLAGSEAPAWKARAAAWLVQRFWRAGVKAPIEPAEARIAAFTAAAEHPGREAALAAAARQLEATPDVVEASLFADLPGERIVHRPAAAPGPDDLIVRTNLLVARSLLLRAGEVVVRTDGELAPLVHLAKRKGLLCQVEPPATVRISGPFALFRRTLLYGRALGDLLPALPAHGRFQLSAGCMLRGMMGELHLSSESPIFPVPGPPAVAAPIRGASRLMAGLAKLGWRTIPPADPVRAGDALLFPDFLIEHADGRWFYVERLGFWTAEHVEWLLSRPLPELVVCVDEERRCGASEPADHPRLVRYRRKLEVAALVAAAPAADPPRRNASGVTPMTATKASPKCDSDE
jgi:predicted nuclease of restriction endonuclease-like RecB superfamily